VGRGNHADLLYQIRQPRGEKRSSSTKTKTARRQRGGTLAAGPWQGLKLGACKTGEPPAIEECKNGLRGPRDAMPRGPRGRALDWRPGLGCEGLAVDGRSAAGIVNSQIRTMGSWTNNGPLLGCKRPGRPSGRCYLIKPPHPPSPRRLASARGILATLNAAPNACCRRAAIVVGPLCWEERPWWRSQIQMSTAKTDGGAIALGGVKS